MSTYVEARDTREKIDIVKLNAEIEKIVAREQVLREEICRKLDNTVDEVIVHQIFADLLLRAAPVHDPRETEQIGKPYRWGGSSPRTGFDCSGLVYYAYKDLVKIRIPRTANEMYHLRDAAPIERSELKNGDLVFFRTQGRGTADHVGVYVGNGKFIQSPRTGQEIQITSLSEDYWHPTIWLTNLLHQFIHCHFRSFLHLRFVRVGKSS